ncbi:MAG: NAD-dependent SIR2 family protein deacetylase [Halioglobus sp.]|jgi:NAD-dependent SIR2 family protein deacetylase
MTLSTHDSQQLTDFLRANPRIVVLTGAGISQAAGIPTYRDAQGQWQHSAPIQEQEFLQQPARRQRYWARSMRGWPPVRDAIPTSAHRALTVLEQSGHIDTIITQNVDRLHQRAGSDRVIDLHGRLDQVRCLNCTANHSRDDIQSQLLEHNGATFATQSLRPDGDVDLPTEQEQHFSVPTCPLCDGIVMPDVVFFGGNVPRERVQQCMDAVERSDALLAIGSSLQVFSGFRFCRRAHQLGKPLMILNPGETRADPIASLKLAADCQRLLPEVAAKARSATQSPSQ